MGILIRADEGSSGVVTFVETTLADGVDGIVVRGIEYVARVEAPPDLPPWAAAVRIRDVAYVHPARKP